jgi:hypothetical protein
VPIFLGVRANRGDPKSGQGKLTALDTLGVKTFQPQKKPKGKELTPEQKEHNSLISSIRIVIEHIIAGIKRCRIVKDLFRNTTEKYDDLVMEIACALHNFRVYCRQS